MTVCAYMHAQSLQLCPVLCGPMDCSLAGFSVHGILWARILEWVAMPTSKRSFQLRDGSYVSSVSCIVSGFLTHWVTWEAQEKALVMSDSLWPQISLSIEFLRQECWRDHHSLLQGIFLIPDLTQGIAGGVLATWATGKPMCERGAGGANNRNPSE